MGYAFDFSFLLGVRFAPQLLHTSYFAVLRAVLLRLDVEAGIASGRTTLADKALHMAVGIDLHRRAGGRGNLAAVSMASRIAPSHQHKTSSRFGRDAAAGSLATLDGDE